MRNVFIDLGANVGDVSARFASENPGYEVFCVEPNLDLIPQIHRRAYGVGQVFNVIAGAAWVYDGTIRLFSSGEAEASTVVAGKVEVNDWPQIDYSSGTETPCFDVSSWLLRNFALQDNVVMKMDVEGAEYEILRKMIQEKSIFLITRLLCEWHYDRFPAVTLETHKNIYTKVSETTQLIEWF